MPSNPIELPTIKATGFRGWLMIGGWDPEGDAPPFVGRLKLVLECGGYRTYGYGVLQNELNRENIRALLMQAAESLSERICNLNGIE